ncbi:MAG: hypothetical protein ACT4O1_10750 [Gemmatimonadota bacterium]
MNSSKRLDPRELHIDREAHPDWVSGLEKTPSIGEIVRCTAGLAEVIKVRGKTGDGTRLVELKLVEGTAPPFFAACSNILVRPAVQPA